MLLLLSKRMETMIVISMTLLKLKKEIVIKALNVGID